MNALWHLKGYRYYKTNLDKLWEKYSHLAHPLFPRSIMPNVTFNLGNVWQQQNMLTLKIVLLDGALSLLWVILMQQEEVTPFYCPIYVALLYL